MVGLDQQRQPKVDPVARCYIFVGIEDNARTWRLWDRHTRRIFVTGDADFRENVSPAADNIQSPDITPFLINHSSLESILSSNLPSTSTTDHIQVDESLLDSQDSLAPNPPTTPYLDLMVTPTSEPILESISTSTPNSELISTLPHASTETTVRRTSRQSTQPQRYGFLASLSTESNHPTYTQAMASPDKAAWLKAMQDEFDSLNRHS